MASSNLIDEDLKKKIQELAEVHNSTEQDIIRQAIEIFDSTRSSYSNVLNSVARKIVQKDLVAVKRDSWKKEIIRKLIKPGIDIDDLRMEFSEVKEY